MTQPLIVDTLRLKRAGAALQALAVPDPPVPIAVAGTDPVSVAINESLPVIESPVSDGLPVAQSALAKTAANLLEAAYRYADTDQQLGRPLHQQEFATTRGVAQSSPATSQSDRRASMAKSELKETPAADQKPHPAVPSDVLPQAPGNAAELGQQFNQIMGTAQTFTQSIFQSPQGASQNQPLEDRVLEDGQRTDTDEEEHPADEVVDGAAPGDEARQRVPTGVGVDAPGVQANTARGADR